MSRRVHLRKLTRAEQETLRGLQPQGASTDPEGRAARYGTHEPRLQL
jgi:hypothetical protein